MILLFWLNLEQSEPTANGDITASLDDVIAAFSGTVSGVVGEAPTGGYLTAEDRRIIQIREEDDEIIEFITAFLEAA
jgi:hypothetical protein